MLKHIKNLCDNCTLCQLGKTLPIVNQKQLDPHVFSNMKISKYVVMGQNPGYNECIRDEPFVGQAGQTFNAEIAKYGLTRDQFYITNILHCYTPHNRAPLGIELLACRPIIQMELMHLNPRLIVTLGKFSFTALCPNEHYASSLGEIRSSTVFNKEFKVFPIYHPSGMNLSVLSRKKKFQRDIELLCKLIKHWENEPVN